MGGLSIAAVGYDVTEALPNYLKQHKMKPGVPTYKRLLHNLESETSTPISLARIDDKSGASSMYYLCCFLDYRDISHNTDELAGVPVPREFIRVKDLLGFEGVLERVTAPKASIFSYDSNGRTRVKQGGRTISGPGAIGA